MKKRQKKKNKKKAVKFLAELDGRWFSFKKTTSISGDRYSMTGQQKQDADYHSTRTYTQYDSVECYTGLESELVELDMEDPVYADWVEADDAVMTRVDLEYEITTGKWEEFGEFLNR